MVRDDQARVDERLGTNTPQAHVMRAHVVWNLPRLSSDRPALRAIGHLVNDWNLSGNVVGARARPNGAGFGVANAYQPARSVQVRAHFSF